MGKKKNTFCIPNKLLEHIPHYSKSACGNSNHVPRILITSLVLVHRDTAYRGYISLFFGTSFVREFLCNVIVKWAHK